MKIIIVGCGRVGSKMAIELFNAGNDVCLIDRNPLAFDKLLSNFGGRIIVGSGTDEDVLIGAGIKEADALISVAKGDNTNIMVGQIAKFLYKLPKVVVRIVDPKSKKFYEEEIGLTCYCPTEVSCSSYIGLLEV
ncbi:potassium channel family protein [Pseudobacteroides cellulosolvens]|uniref:TrkA-N domain protein n=1 Tax=Pseudobacteroides cellulosolvens ATCC 35603 = DSM 2933 TaxID=398512 RepID=A0A0L6JSF6_9FIRM|nr:NAD-binding protein [Pseudobacteroides cellulosolvens]KNY28347.1 TrkA-N domain protein [Pseudobacteroides cellulosolvens ATCC 35603 = DSM 2933]